VKDSRDQNEVFAFVKPPGEKKAVRSMVPVDHVYRILDSVKAAADLELLGFAGKDSLETHPRNLVLRNVLVPPPCNRPASEQEGKIWPNELTLLLEELIKKNETLAKELKGTDEPAKMRARANVNKQLLNLFLLPSKQTGSETNIKPLIQSIQGKTGIPRGDLMGKRVDFSARTVIGPGPHLRFGEVGISREMAKTLTQPETVTALNLRLLRAALRAGKVERIQRGATGPMMAVTEATRQSYEPQLGDVFHRHLRDGDMVVVNRNPTLSMFSMMSMQAVIHSELTTRLHLSYTTPYNADFDGDEMNVHKPQDLMAEAEMKTLMSSVACIMSGANNKNAMGIVFNGITASYILTKENPPVSPETYYQALELLTVKTQLGTLDERLAQRGVAPYTGRALISAVFPENFYYRAGGVQVVGGVLVQGELKMDHLGPRGGSMVQKMWHLYGQERTACFISDVAFVVNYWLDNEYGLTMGITDCYPDDATFDPKVPVAPGETRVSEMRQAIVTQVESIKAKVRALGGTPEDPVQKELMEQRLRNRLDVSKFGKERLKSLRNQAGQTSALALSIYAGTKGKEFNAQQMQIMLGQQMFLGERLEGLWQYFDDQDPNMNLEAHGFVKSSFMTGLTPAELFQHQKAAREGEIDKALNTATSGFTHHQIIKTSEDIRVNRLGMVTNSLGVIFQFAYGEDGLAPEYLQKVTTSRGQRLSFVDMHTDVEVLNTDFGF
jgi:DNA-directed RNA polymerase II subunit RPB1